MVVLRKMRGLPPKEVSNVVLSLAVKNGFVRNFDSIKTNSSHSPGYEQGCAFFCRNTLDVGSGVVRLNSSQGAIAALNSFEILLKNRYSDLQYVAQFPWASITLKRWNDKQFHLFDYHRCACRGVGCVCLLHRTKGKKFRWGKDSAIASYGSDSAYLPFVFRLSSSRGEECS